MCPVYCVNHVPGLYLRLREPVERQAVHQVLRQNADGNVLPYLAANGILHVATDTMLYAVGETRNAE